MTARARVRDDAVGAAAPALASSRVRPPGPPERRWRPRRGLVAPAIGLAALLVIVEAVLVWAGPASGADGPLRFGAAAVVTLGAAAGAFAALDRRERRREARLVAYARRYALAVRWDEQLEALHTASLEIARENAYPAVLQTIVDLASGLARARYGALAVFAEDGSLEEFVTYGVTGAERERIGMLPSHRGLLAELNGSGAVRLPDVHHSPAFTGLPTGHPIFRTFLGVAVRWEGELLGHLYLGGHVGEVPFEADEERLLQMFASEAALAIARQRLYAAYARAVRSAERRRIAMGLHDRTLQGLYALALQLGRARRQGTVQLTDSMTVEAALSAVERSMASIRALLDTLQSEERASAEAVDCRQAVEETAALCGVGVTFEGEDLLGALDPGARGEVALCLCEAVTNAARHGHARRVRIAVRVRQALKGAPGALARLHIHVVDDGEGARAMAVSPGHGLSHIAERAQALGGEARFVGRQAGGGAGVHIRLPIHVGGEHGKGGEGNHGAHSDRG